MFTKKASIQNFDELPICHGRLKTMTNDRRGHKKLKQGNYNLLELTQKPTCQCGNNTMRSVESSAAVPPAGHLQDQRRQANCPTAPEAWPSQYICVCVYVSMYSNDLFLVRFDMICSYV